MISIITYLCIVQLKLKGLDVYDTCNSKTMCATKREYSQPMKDCIGKFSANDSTNNKGVNK